MGTLPMFHPPLNGSHGPQMTGWRESGIPIVKAQYSTDGTRTKSKSCYSAEMAAMHGGGRRNFVPEKVREDIRQAIKDRNATRFVDAMEFMEGVFDQEEM